MASPVPSTGPRMPRPRPYKDFLTPSLHRKFTRAAGTALLACYVEAVLIGDKSSYFWLWFPLGRAGIRTILLFVSVLILFMLRVSHMKFGQRTAVAPIAQVNHLAGSFILLQTFCFYLLCAWWYSEIYVWSASEDADLSWVKPDDENGRDRLNERPIFLRSNMALLALAMAALHLYRDYDQIEVQQYPVLDGNSNVLSQKTGFQIISSKLLQRLISTSRIAVVVTLGNFALYAFVFRRFAWSWSLWIGRLIWDIPRSAEPSVIPPYHYTLILRAMASSILLACLCEVSNMAFSAWVCQPPLKFQKPLTSESRDPNSSLINGLKSRKSLTKTSALWELSLISGNFEERRRTIFAEIDRQGADSTWKQVLEACLAVVESMNIRLEDNRSPPPDLVLAASREKDVQRLPRLSAPLKADPILQASPKATNRVEMVESRVGAFAKSISQTPGSTPTSGQDSPARKFLRKAQNSLTGDSQIQTEQVSSMIQSAQSNILSSTVGTPFRQTFANRVQVKVFGTPRSELPALLFAIYSISQLAVAGITEDTMGTVNRDIPLIMRTFGNVIGRIQKFVRESQVHWTDVEFKSKEESARRVEEVEFLVAYLRAALRHIIKGYEGFARDMGIAPSELKAARVAAGLESF